MKFNVRLRYLRRMRNITQRELAKQLSYGSSAISNYESGKNEPSIEDLIKLARYFNVSVGYLIGAETFDKERTMKRIYIDQLKQQLKVVQEDINKMNEIIEIC